MANSSHPMLSHTDGVATSMTDVLLLVGRILLAMVFLMIVTQGSPNAAYLKSINFMSPDFMSVFGQVVEWIVVVSLILGLGTRYGALLALVFVVIAIITAHLYWQYPAAAQGLQWVFLSKDLCIAGGLLVLFVTGAGKISVDNMLANR